MREVDKFKIHPNVCLNESPSKKEGKFRIGTDLTGHGVTASMKAPPRRKGNAERSASLLATSCVPQ